MNLSRRRVLLAALGGFAPLMAGCMTKPLRPANVDGTYCYRIGKSPRPSLTCTSVAIPAAAVEDAAKRFEPTPGVLTAYLVRKRWGDAGNVVRVGATDATAVDTVPESLVRWRLSAGTHRLTATWSGGCASTDIAGGAGEVIYVELIGRDWIWGSSYRLERGNAVDSRQRAMPLRLVADVG